MRRSFFVVLLSLLLSSVVCRAESLTRHFVVEHKQTSESFSIKHNLNSLLGNPTHLADTNDYAWAVLPSDDKSHRLDGYTLKTTFIESISWQLLYATNLLVAYELFLTTHDAALSGKTYSWIPEEAFVAVGWLLKSYWNPDSVMFNPRDQLKASQDDPFAINTMMLPGQSQQQSDQQNPPSESSGQQTPGATAHVRGSVKRRLSSGSGRDNEGFEQEQHTLGLECYVDSCHGVCKFRKLSNSTESAEEPPNSIENPIESSTDHTTQHAMAKTQPSRSQANEVVSGVIEHMIYLQGILTENDVHFGATTPNPDIQVFENAIQLLKYLQPCDISVGEEVSDGRDPCGCCDGSSDTYYPVYYKGDVLFTVTETNSESRFPEEYTSGQWADIATNKLFDELYFAPDAPGYLSAKSEFEQLAKPTGQVYKN
ncbi:hypothetical protein [Endozoicomonas sp. ISHI1]|uniref:hypothetical protein n=1 Tax=Endozoicomonas sp. ISHI1 TaxID=2825882 RepID=UPI002147A8E0|nr:hypothetical protein [Endozoicomonas sp. ISHI1]